MTELHHFSACYIRILSWRCAMLCISSFVDDVTFSRNDPVMHNLYY